MKKIISGLVMAFMICSIQIKADVKMPRIFTDNMVLQRDIPLKIWGWADANEKVTVSFNGQKVNTKADAEGNWMVKLQAMTFGGPFDLTVKAKNDIVLKNILIGDVWICSGQSNMEFETERADHADQELVNANIPDIRMITVNHQMIEKPARDILSKGWAICNAESVKHFSAVGYFFGKNIYNDLKIPIGLICSSWGGTNVEAWTSMETMDTIDNYKAAIEEMKKNSFDKLMADNKTKTEQWITNIESNDKGTIEKWYQTDVDLSSWKEMNLPQYWEHAGLENVDGIVWFSREFYLTDDEAAKDLVINLGTIDDNDVTYLNGQKVGETKGYDVIRTYKISKDKLKTGKNILVVKVTDTGGDGGFYGEPEKMFMETLSGKKSLSGNWYYKAGIVSKSPVIPWFSPNVFPSSLYNGMISPFIYFGIKGVIWYQGESNATDAYKYRILFPNMIQDWRNKWKLGDFPFLFVQLANFEAAAKEDWPVLRESQTKTLSLANTGMAVTIDIGLAKNIHPTDKQDVGYRLSLAARKIAYNENIEFAGPLYKEIKINGSKVIISFDHAETGFIINDKYGYLKGFEIAGADKKFFWAKASIQNNKVVVESDEVKSPAIVRYGWSNNPEDVNLYNQEGLPASPFRSGVW